jgi:hypothetical protein
VAGRIELQHLCQPDVVARQIPERGVDSVRLIGRWIVELDAARRQLVIARLTVVGLQEKGAACRCVIALRVPRSS